jgi:hypothetical protein
MIRYTTISMYILLGWGGVFAQLLPRALNLTLPEGGKISGVEAPVVRQNKQATSLLSIAITLPINRQVKYSTEITSIERFNDSGVAFISRSNHWLAYQSLVFELNKRPDSFLKTALALSSYSFMDNQSFKPVTQHWELRGNLEFINKSSIQILYQYRYDQLFESFSLSKLHIQGNLVNYRSVSIRYNVNPGHQSIPFIETRLGYYYQHSRFHSIRLGNTFSISQRLIGYADIEFSQVRGEVRVQGIVSRLKMDYKINKTFSTGFYMLNNSYDRFNGLLIYLELNKNNHTIRLEYREKRNEFHFTESVHPFFASHLMIQYRYFIPYDGCKGRV